MISTWLAYNEAEERSQGVAQALCATTKATGHLTTRR
jgi:hypothetical protein